MPDSAPPQAYITAIEADRWFAERHLNDWHEQTEEIRTAALLRASEWIDQSFTFIGQPEASGQVRAWPRMNAFLRNGQAVRGIPGAVIESVYILAEALIEDDAAAEGALGLGAQISSHKAAGVEIRYDTNAAGQTRIQRLLAPLLEYHQSGQLIRRG